VTSVAAMMSVFIRENLSASAGWRVIRGFLPRRLVDSQ
jgi:hypothetical protein